MVESSTAERSLAMKSKQIAFLVSLMVMALSAVSASAASASPSWKFNGANLVGVEAVLGTAHLSTLSVPGAPVSCETIELFMEITNSVTPGRGEVTNFAPYECTATGNCTVQSIEAEKLPWPVHATTAGGKNYVVIEKMQVSIKYVGALCALAGTTIVKGSAGGLFENATSTLTFNKASFEATGTSLKVGASAIQWTGVFPMEALGTHSGESLEVA
jgi:hypothetical protein